MVTTVQPQLPITITRADLFYLYTNTTEAHHIPYHTSNAIPTTITTTTLRKYHHYIFSITSTSVPTTTLYTHHIFFRISMTNTITIPLQSSPVRQATIPTIWNFDDKRCGWWSQIISLMWRLMSYGAGSLASLLLWQRSRDILRLVRLAVGRILCTQRYFGFTFNIQWQVGLSQVSGRGVGETCDQRERETWQTDSPEVHPAKNFTWKCTSPEPCTPPWWEVYTWDGRSLPECESNQQNEVCLFEETNFYSFPGKLFTRLPKRTGLVIHRHWTRKVTANIIMRPLIQMVGYIIMEWLCYNGMEGYITP